MREYMREYYRRKRHPPEDPVPDPPAPPQRLTLDQLAAKARSEGKTYGQLRAEMLLEKMRREKRRRLEETVSCLKAEITLDELIRISRLEGEALRKWLVEMIRKQEERAE